MSDLNIIVPGAVCVKNFFKFSHQVFCKWENGDSTLDVRGGMAEERWMCVAALPFCSGSRMQESLIILHLRYLYRTDRRLVRLRLQPAFGLRPLSVQQNHKGF